MAELHPLRQTLLTETRDYRQQLDPPTLGPKPFRRPLLEIASHLPDDHHGLGLRILLELLQVADIIGPGIGVAADADRRGNAIRELRTNPNNFVGEATRFRDDAKGALTIKLAGDEVIEGAADHS